MKPAAKKKMIEAFAAAEAEPAKTMAKAIHHLAEPPFHETRSAQVLADYLAERGFRVTFPFTNIPTAFRAVWGRGKPVVGLLGEYDALPNCGEKEGTWGHGCGHDLLGTAAAVGAALAKAALQKTGQRGQVVFYGCPAEETLAGKVYMARDGAFRDLDFVLAWHPGAKTAANNVGGSALDSLVYEFFGRTAHGASAHHGRSALDAVMLMDVAANYLREHVEENVRIHMVVRDGGDAPNVVPAYAKAWYYVRGKDRKQVDAVRQRLDQCAKGAALATDTRVRKKRLTAIYSRLPNDCMAANVLRNLQLFGAPKATVSDERIARKHRVKPEFPQGVSEGFGTQGRGSTDEDSVSWLVPMGRFTMASQPKNVPGHHRLRTLVGQAPFAHACVLQAAKVLAGCAVDLLTDAAYRRKASAEFRRRTRGFTYDPLIPKRQAVPVNPP